ncbi:MAG: Fic family protein [Lachnospiraceae bacterium]|nr:Fic family protein [Lachnospiraceae bacterium]
MADEYFYEQDTFYCYPNTNVLKNKLGITDEAELKKAEREITALRTAQLLQNPIGGVFDFIFLKKIHQFLFGDIYEWAGKTRNVNISKGNQFCRCEFIEEQMNIVMQQLKEENYLAGMKMDNLASRLAFYLGEINAIHPFREGNGRTQRMFVGLLAERNGYYLDFTKITKEEMLKASLDTFNLEYGFMTELLLKALAEKGTAQ